MTALAALPPDLPTTDRLIVRLKGGASVTTKSAAEREAMAARLSERAGEYLRPVRAMGDGAQVLQLPGHRSLVEIARISRYLAADPEVLEVLPDRLAFPALIPNDTQFASQWYLTQAEGIDAPAAWDLTTGLASHVIAIVDTGILPHAQLAGRVLPGYDFVSDLARANDGDLRDASALDPGDWVSAGDIAPGGPFYNAGCGVTDSRWHGTAMAGVIAANANDGTGIAGINWNAQILPVRAVGKCGGYTSDIADGIRWAAGLAVAGAPTNANPAKVINVSLAAAGACDSIYQGAIDDVTALGATVVVAAGNQSQPASQFTPASCTNVITVGAVRRDGGLPAYANTGTAIALSAPGGLGNTAIDAILTTFDGDGIATGLTSAVNDSSYRAVNGSSISAAQVSGVASLMRSMNPTLSSTGIRDILIATARAFPGTATNPCNTSLCGAGIASAHAALLEAQSLQGITVPSVAAGGFHSAVVTRDGRVFAWGVNTYGQLGDGTQSSTSYPILVPGITDAMSLAAGFEQTFVARSDGSVWGWGRDLTLSPTAISGLMGVVMVAGGEGGSFIALRADGTVWGYRTNPGDGTTYSAVPVQATGLSDMRAIAASRNARLAVKGDGTVWAWGEGYTSAPAMVVGLTGVVAVAVGNAPGPLTHFLALKDDGAVWTWGSNNYGQLGDGTTTARMTPAAVPGLANVIHIAAGLTHSMAVRADGTLWAWGDNYDGQLGNGAYRQPPPRGALYTPQLIAGISGVARVSGSNHSVAVTQAGIVYAWGTWSDTGSLSPNFPSTNGAPPLAIGTDPFNFLAQADVTPGSVRTSNLVQITGIANGTAIDVSGGEYSIGCSGTFTSAPGTINDGDVLCTRQTAAATLGTMTVAVVRIAGARRFFSVTTASDATPAFFEFAPMASQPTNTAVVSGAVTISGINVAAPISVTGGEYSIGCTASFTSAAGTINNGQTVCVRQTTSAANNMLSTATLTVGTFSAAFHATTIVDAAFTIAPMVSAGVGHMVGLSSDGTVWTWGDNAYGQMGDGSISAATGRDPAIVPGISGVISVTAGGDFVVALRPDGTVWTWGRDFRQIPTKVTWVNGASKIAAGESHFLVLKNDGTVWTSQAWGGNGQPAQVSTGHTSESQIAAGSDFRGMAWKADASVWAWGPDYFSATETQVTALDSGCGAGVNRPVTRIAMGGTTYLAMRSTGTLCVWGATIGMSPQAKTVGQPPDPDALMEAGTSHQVASGYGQAYAWGSGEYGQLGNGQIGASVAENAPKPVTGLADAIAIAAGQGSSVAIRANGEVTFWGTLFNYRFSYLPANLLEPDGETFSLLRANNQPRQFAFLPRFGVVVSLAVDSNPVTISGLGATASSSVSVTGGLVSINGGAFTATPGSVVNGSTVTVRVQSAAGFNTLSSATVAIGGVTSTFFVKTLRDPSVAAIVPAVALGNSHTYLLGADGTVYAFGYNGNGQLGNGTTVGSAAPRPVIGLGSMTGIVSGSDHALALRADGTVLAWGYNIVGQVGDGSIDFTKRSPVAVASLTGIDAVSAGRFHSLALKSDGTVQAWGHNLAGQLGADPADTPYSATPMAVPGLSGIDAVSAGGRHSLALTFSGTVLAWGANESGQLGDGTTMPRFAPATVPGLSGVIAIAACGAHSLALKSDGTAVAWGANDFGQLGNGSTTNSTTPVAISALGTGVGQIACGESHSLAVRVGGGLYTWGKNVNSQLGDGTNANRTTPALLAAPANVVAISGGARHSAAITASRKLYVWGDNFFGQVGNRSGNYSPHSASLNVLRGDSVISTGTEGSGGGVGTGSDSGSSILEVDGQQAGFDFGSLTSGGLATIAGKYKNASATEDVTGISIGVTGSSFGLSANTCPTTLTPDAECNFTLAFSPATAATYQGELVVSSSVIGSPERRSLIGTGAPLATAAIAFATNGLDFPPQTVGAATSPSLHTVTNTGNANLTITSIASTLGDFAPGHSCNNIGPGASCAISVVFTPAAAGGRTAYLTVNSNASGTPHSVTVFGTGVATLTPSYTLTVNRTGTGTGTVTSVTPAGGISCGGDCSESYVSGTAVTLSASAAGGSVFAGWSGGGCSGAGNCQVTMSGPVTVTATFDASATAPPRSGFNGDARSDVFWRDSTSGLNYQWQMNGLAISGQGYMPSVPSNWMVAGVGDVSGDGIADVFWREAGGLNYLWVMSGLGVSSQGYLPTVANPWGVVGLGDASGDGKADVFWRNPTSGQNYLWIMNGLAIASQGYLPSVAGPDWEVVGVADYSGDGKADVLWRNKTTGANYLWVMNGLVVASQGYLPSVTPVDWEVAGSPDANGDGKADVLWRHKVNGQMYLWVMNGFSVTSQGYLPTVADASWKVVGFGDYNGDGKGDVLWRHATSGQNYLWTLNGIGVATQGYLPSVIGANWQPVR